MKRYVIIAAAVALAVTGCGRKASESLAEKMAERAMARDGVKGQVHISDGKVTMETKDGTTSYAVGEGTQVPATFPKDVHVYAGAKVVTSMTVPKGHSLMLESKDSVEKILAAYKSKMTGEGWKEEMSMNQSGSSMLVYKKEARTTSIVVTASAGAAQIALTVASE
jgi:hypothetical protein